MKKFVSVLLAILVVISLTSCFSSGSSSSEKISNEDLTPTEKFAEDNEVSAAFAESLGNAVQNVTDKYQQSFDIGDVYDFRATNDWANGKRYTIYLGQQYVLTVYEQDDAVVSIRSSNGDLVYSAN